MTSSENGDCHFIIIIIVIIVIIFRHSLYGCCEFVITLTDLTLYDCM